MAERSKHIGSSVDDFLEEENTLSEISCAAAKRILAWQIAQEMQLCHLSKSEMARRMKTSRAALDRLMDPDNGSVTLNTIYRAAQVLGKRVSLKLVKAA